MIDFRIYRQQLSDLRVEIRGLCCLGLLVPARYIDLKAIDALCGGMDQRELAALFRCELPGTSGVSAGGKVDRDRIYASILEQRGGFLLHAAVPLPAESRGHMDARPAVSEHALVKVIVIYAENLDKAVRDVLLKAQAIRYGLDAPGR